MVDVKKMKQVNVEVGDSIGHASEKLAREAPAFMVHNGVRVEASPGDTARDLQARWQAGFELACEEERRQRRAYEQTAEGKVKAAAAAAQADEESRTREEALRVVALSGVREKYPWTNEMDEISGMGAVCENAFRDMLYSGLAWLDGHAGADLKASAYRNIIGALNADSDDAKLLEKAVLAVCPGALGSMHEAVMSACIFIALRGWAAYVEAMTKAK